MKKNHGKKPSIRELVSHCKGFRQFNSLRAFKFELGWISFLLTLYELYYSNQLGALLCLKK